MGTEVSMGAAGAGASRRVLLVAGSAGAVGAVAALAGCEVYGGGGDPPAPPPAGGGSAGTVLASAGEVPVGGGLIVVDHQVVVTQPIAGDFRGFTAVCTHQGCIVGTVSDGTINCPCHGSRFSIEDGSIVQPAAGASADTQPPLPTAAITVDGETIALG